MIRATLETAVQSDLPGMVRAITTEDVYWFDGRRILLPKATMLDRRISRHPDAGPNPRFHGLDPRAA